MDQVSETPSRKPRLATVWLGGCSGCHMSFLDLDEWLIELAQRADIVYSPLMDIKEFPAGVDATLVEGAVANEDNLEQLRLVRERTAFLISFGDCAVNGNVTALRNPLRSAAPVLKRAYLENVTIQPQLPNAPGIVPELLDRVRPIHELVKVDLFMPGCPPLPGLIAFALTELLEGRVPDLSGKLKYG